MELPFLTLARWPQHIDVPALIEAHALSAAAVTVVVQSIALAAAAGLPSLYIDDQGEIRGWQSEGQVLPMIGDPDRTWIPCG